MKFEFLQGDEVWDLALKINEVIPIGTSNRATLGALGGLAATLLSDLAVKGGDKALMQILEDWTVEIAAKAMLIAKLDEEGFDFVAYSMGRLPTAGEA